MGIQGLEQSIPICLALAAVGGVLEVFATALLAYADAKDKVGQKFSPCRQRLALVGNLVLQISASIVGNLFAPWFGPVSLVGPFFLGAQLLANMIVYGFFLGLEAFSKDMKIGTYVTVVSAALLPVVGPTAQDDQDVLELLSRYYSLAWSGVLVVGMIVALVFLPCVNKLKNISLRYVVLLVARSTAFTVNLTVSKLMVANLTLVYLIVSIVLKVVSGAVMTYAIVVQSTAVKQATFVPINASMIMVVNAVTGIILWEDWRVVQSWLGYVCIFVLMILGNFLLLGNGPSFEADNERYGRAYVLDRVAGKRDLFEDMSVFTNQRSAPSLKHAERPQKSISAHVQDAASIARDEESVSICTPEISRQRHRRHITIDDSVGCIKSQSSNSIDGQSNGDNFGDDYQLPASRRKRPPLVRSPSKTLTRPCAQSTLLPYTRGIRHSMEKPHEQRVWEDICGVDDNFLRNGGNTRGKHIFRIDNDSNSETSKEEGSNDVGREEGSSDGNDESRAQSTCADDRYGEC